MHSTRLRFITNNLDLSNQTCSVNIAESQVGELFGL